MIPAHRRAVALGLIVGAVIGAPGCAAREDDSLHGDTVAPSPVDAFVPGFEATDSASVALAAWLESVREGGRAPAAGPAVRAGCGGDTAVVHPVEMLSSWEITGRTPRGDTTVVRARTVTVAEEDVMGTTPQRYLAVARSRQSEWEWDVVREGEEWRICNGPRFGFVGTDSVTSWRPAGTSRAAVRARAESLWAATRRPDER